LHEDAAAAECKEGEEGGNQCGGGYHQTPMLHVNPLGGGHWKGRKGRKGRKLRKLRKLRKGRKLYRLQFILCRLQLILCGLQLILCPLRQSSFTTRPLAIASRVPSTHQCPISRAKRLPDFVIHLADYVIHLADSVIHLADLVSDSSMHVLEEAGDDPTDWWRTRWQWW